MPQVNTYLQTSSNKVVYTVIDKQTVSKTPQIMALINWTHQLSAFYNFHPRKFLLSLNPPPNLSGFVSCSVSDSTLMGSFLSDGDEGTYPKHQMPPQMMVDLGGRVDWSSKNWSKNLPVGSFLIWSLKGGYFRTCSICTRWKLIKKIMTWLDSLAQKQR